MTGITDNTAVIILAAGKGTRMKSDRAKVLHELNAVPMIHYVVKTALALTRDHVHVVVGHQAAEVKQAVNRHFDAGFVTQADQKGTGHAVQCALPYLSETVEHVVILCGDVPLLTFATVQRLLTRHCQEQSDITVLAVHVADPKGYGRVIVNENEQMEGIVEEADADDHEKGITLINSGIYCIRKSILEETLNRIGANNAQNEFYLTDIIGIGYRQGLRLGVEIGDDSNEVIGINTLVELERAEKILRA
ncbi:MAG: NTP transferase domain-containing protein [Desulfobacterales bacterium]|nr:NTP transferase domain-containing protein [Desulfobacterales bacterium]